MNAPVLVEKSTLIDDSLTFSWLLADLASVDLTESTAPPKYDVPRFRMVDHATETIMRVYVIWARYDALANKAAATIRRWRKKNDYYDPEKTKYLERSRRNRELMRILHLRLARRDVAAILLLDEIRNTFPSLKNKARHASELPALFNGWKVGRRLNDSVEQEQEC